MSLALTHTRFHLLHTLRIPIAFIGSAFFPALSMLFFVVPFTADDAIGATYATASMVTFAVMTSNLFQHGVGVAEDRAQPWDAYSRTLPAGPGPRFAGRIIAGLVMTLSSLLPVLLVALLFTPAHVSPAGLALATGAVVVTAIPFTLMGLAIGYALPVRAALVVAQIVFLPLAFLGGLLTAPTQPPSFVAAVEPYVPTHGGVELMWAAVGDYPLQPRAIIMLAVWAVALAVIAVWAWRRDEGRRFR